MEGCYAQPGGKSIANENVVVNGESVQTQDLNNKYSPEDFSRRPTHSAKDALRNLVAHPKIARGGLPVFRPT
jgi:hypothetical protein